MDDTDTTRITIRSRGYLHDMPAQLDAADYDVSLHHLHVHLPRVIR